MRLIKPQGNVVVVEVRVNAEYDDAIGDDDTRLALSLGIQRCYQAKDPRSPALRSAPPVPVARIRRDRSRRSDGLAHDHHDSQQRQCQLGREYRPTRRL
jgi:hypothetical protein